MTMNSGELLGDVVLLGVAGYMINNMNNNNNRNRNNNNQNNNAPRRKTYAVRRKQNTGTVRRATRRTKTQRENRDWTLGSPFGQ